MCIKSCAWPIQFGSSPMISSLRTYVAENAGSAAQIARMRNCSFEGAAGLRKNGSKDALLAARPGIKIIIVAKCLSGECTA